MYDGSASCRVLELIEVYKHFGRKQAVCGVSLEIGQGEIVGFLGPNGAGKTTVMSMVTGLYTPDSGKIRLFGDEGGVSNPAQRLRMAFLQEKPRLYPEMTGRSYLHFFANLYGIADARLRVNESLSRFGLEQAADRPAGTYSRGMQQRLCLARTLLHGPEFVILDEPTLGLDPSGVRDIRDTIVALNRAGTAFLLSSHQLTEMERICHRIILMNHGEVVASGSRESISRSLQGGLRINIELDRENERIVPALQSHTAVATVKKSDGARYAVTLAVSPGSAGEERQLRAALSTLATQTGAVVLSVDAEMVSLEQAFLKLTRPQQP